MSAGFNSPGRSIKTPVPGASRLLQLSFWLAPELLSGLAPGLMLRGAPEPGLELLCYYEGDDGGDDYLYATSALATGCGSFPYS
jgi:hypothetical protein